MMFLTTVLLVTVLLMVVFAVLVAVKTPRYRLEASDLIGLLRGTLAHQIGCAEWNLKTSVPFRHDAQLEQARKACLKIENEFWLGGEKLLTHEGMDELRAVLGRLELQYPQVAKQSQQRF